MSRYLYLDPSLAQGRVFEDPRLAGLTERHKLELSVPALAAVAPPFHLLETLPDVAGAVLALGTGCPSRRQIALAGQVAARGRAVFFHWPAEAALERVDGEKLRSFRRLRLAYLAFHGGRRVPVLGHLLAAPPAKVPAPVDLPLDSEAPMAEACPVPLGLRSRPRRDQPLPGTGVYLRTDYWAPIHSGGSYGHTCYVARELAATTERLVCFTPHRYALLDQLGLHQVVLDPPAPTSREEDLLAASATTYRALKPALQALKPVYLYERLCLGNHAGATLSRELGIPYIVEYNGSELSMRRSFQGDHYRHEGALLRAEAAAFGQATLISVVSEAIRDDLLGRGVDPRKVLVNPNGADLEAYAPASADEKRALRRELGLGHESRVMCFIGTFGGWHGIEVLAEAIPRICSRVPEAEVLLIGDGPLKPLVDAQVARHDLGARVRSTGRVAQAAAARLLRAADIYVSPHHGHMVDSRFFGSPTKLFEYMALGGGIVASDLEQIGQVLSPALRPSDLQHPGLEVSGQRAVLCPPGDLEAFVEAVVGLTARPQVAARLGRNARQAVVDCYSWARHVEKLWQRLEADPTGSASPPPAVPLGRIETGDPYKDQVQHQWNHNPVGSQYVKNASRHTLEWFLEVEAHRYGVYAPWMPETMEFTKQAGKRLLEIGGGMGTDLAQFAKAGAIVTDIDLSLGHLELARENFRLRGLPGCFIHHDAETLPFEDGAFDVVYSHGVIHHTPNTARLIDEMQRVLRPGGRLMVMVYAEDSLHYWGQQVFRLGLRDGLIEQWSMGEILSRSVEMTANGARPLVKVYTRQRLRRLFARFSEVEVVKRQLTAPELPAALGWVPLGLAARVVGWNLVVKATRPA